MSLGTGKLSEPIPYKRARRWGILGWAWSLLSTVVDGTSDMVDHQARVLVAPTETEERYYRLQAHLDSGYECIDDTSAENIAELRRLAAQVIRDNSDALDAITAQLQTT